MNYEQITFRELTFGITEDEIDSVLMRGSGVYEGKTRIRKFFEAHPDQRDRMEMLKNEYGIGGRSHVINGFGGSFESHDGKGIKIAKDEDEVLISWSRAERIIDRLIKEGRY